MTMPWFKFHTASRHDGKLWTLTGDQYRTFSHLLSYAAEQPVRGTIQDTSELVIANETTRGNIELLRETLAALVDLRCVTCVTSDVTGVTVTFINFEKRQNSRYIGNACEPGSSRDRVRKHRQAKKLGNVTSEACNGVTSRYNQPLDRDREEERNTPLTPNGGKSEPGQDSRQPVTIEAEPFDSGQSDPLPKAPLSKPKFDPDPSDVARLISKASPIFPNDFDLGPAVSSIAKEFPTDWISEALDIAREKKANGWVFVRRVLARFTAQGASDNEKAAREWKKQQSTSLWNQPSHVPEPDPRRPKMRSINALSESEILEFRSRGVA